MGAARRSDDVAILVLTSGDGEHIALSVSKTPVQEYPRIHLDPYAGDAADQAAEIERQAVALHDETWHGDVDRLCAPCGVNRQSRDGPARGGPSASPLSCSWLSAPAHAGVGTGAGRPGRIGAAAVRSDDRQLRDRIAVPDGAEADATIGTGHLLMTVEDVWWRLHDGNWQVTLHTTTENDTPVPQYDGDWRYSSLVVGQRPFDVACFSQTRRCSVTGSAGISSSGVIAG